MIDPLFARAERAIEESVMIRQERRLLHEAFGPVRDQLRLRVLECAMAWSEAVALRQNQE